MPLTARHFEAVREIALPRAAVWHVLSHTDRLNRHIGLAAVKYGEVGTDSEGFFRFAQATVGGMKMQWREYPFQWERDTGHSVVRLYDKGPIARFEGGIELEDAGNNRTRLKLFSDITPRGALGSALVPVIARQFMNKTLAYCDRKFDGSPAPRPQAPKPRQDTVNRPILSRLIRELQRRPLKEGYAEALATLLSEGGDDEVAALRPYEWADNCQLDRAEALRTCLHAVKSGLLNLSWSMMCPNCRVSQAEAGHLNDVTSKVHCELCGVSYDLNFDRYVELKFAVHPVVRQASLDIFCIAGPFQTPHILVQKRIGPGETETIASLSNEPLRLRVMRDNKSLEVFPDAPRIFHLAYDGENWSAPAARGPFSVTNASEEPIMVVLERQIWDDGAVTAAHVTSLQEFRDMFSSEVLRPGRQLALENVTLFFSDLSNSTALYESIGDGPAYGRVGSHFDFLTRHIAANNGAVVKTMGDAVMAVFNSPVDAVGAALIIQSEFRTIRDTLSESGAIDIKIGLHHGPALVVNSNDRLDYFGRTVNIAARVAGASQHGDFVLTGEVWEYSEVQKLLVTSGVQLRRFEVKLRGVEQIFPLVRVVV